MRRNTGLIRPGCRGSRPQRTRLSPLRHFLSHTTDFTAPGRTSREAFSVRRRFVNRRPSWNFGSHPTRLAGNFRIQWLIRFSVLRQEFFHILTSHGGGRRSRHPFTNTITRNREGLGLKFGCRAGFVSIQDEGRILSSLAADPFVKDRLITNRHFPSLEGLIVARDPTQFAVGRVLQHRFLPHGPQLPMEHKLTRGRCLPRKVEVQSIVPPRVQIDRIGPKTI